MFDFTEFKDNLLIVVILFNFSNFRFRYGNFNQYYGSRLETKFQRDPRLDLFNDEWFRGKAVLDIGCNIGVVTILLAKEFGPRRIIGLDIDSTLIGVARKNIRHYCDADVKVSHF